MLRVEVCHNYDKHTTITMSQGERREDFVLSTEAFRTLVDDLVYSAKNLTLMDVTCDIDEDQE